MIRSFALTSLASFFATACAQQPGAFQQVESHPMLAWQKCVTAGLCQTQAGWITLDADWRPLHSTEGVDSNWYSYIYGVNTSGNSLQLNYITQYWTTSNPNGRNMGSRVFLMADNTHYQLFKLKNRETRFDVDASNLPCGVKGSLYFVAMDADGGMQKYPDNNAGAQYGTGYCDGKCSRSVRFINGEANTWDWSQIDEWRGNGFYGSCCLEIDAWEGNSISSALTYHACSLVDPYRCEDVECDYIYDKDGCDFNSYRNGDTTFYGNRGLIDTTKKMSIITQFYTIDGTDMGILSEIRRVYVQDGKVVQNSKVKISGMSAHDSITGDYCNAQATAFGEPNDLHSTVDLSRILHSIGGWCWQ
ncbi:hypothetical protein FRC03_011649 [Tulasnella sp. 419]|nr:hypothetical protein FRC03_011649 [Tulasnella sp. 419]